MLVEDAQSIPGVTLMDAIDLLRFPEDGEEREVVVPPMDPDEGVAQLNAFLGGAR